MIYRLLFAIDSTYRYLQDALDEAGSTNITGIAVAWKNTPYVNDADEFYNYFENLVNSDEIYLWIDTVAGLIPTFINCNIRGNSANTGTDLGWH